MPKSIYKPIAEALVGMAIVLLTGCSGLQQTAPVAVQGQAFRGNVHGGQQPISGSAIALYATGNSGYGSAYSYTAGTSLLGNHTVTTDANGGFNITADYTCPSSSALVYLVGTGGNPGLGSGVNNPNIALMAALGPCGNLSSSTFITVNEITTVGTVWALSPFMTGPANLGTSASNAQGLTNAFAAVNKVVNTGTGSVSGPALPAGAVLPINKINTLADILAACINSAGGVSGDGSPCGTLFAATTVGSVAPTNTVNAALNIAQHPNQSVSTLTALVPPASPFQPTLSAAPNDYSIAISYNGGGLSGTRGVAVDSAGNVWVPNAGNNSVTKLDNTGASLSGTTGFMAGLLNQPSSIAIDTSGNAWVTNNGGTTVTAMTPGGVSLPNSPYTVGSAPSALAFDATGNVWVSNSGSNSVSVLSSAGLPLQSVTTGIAAPTAIAINPK